MPRVILSTVGTSLLTNQADGDQRRILSDHANNTEEDCPTQVSQIIEICEELARERLNAGIEEARNTSAELNGIYGIYGSGVPQDAGQDVHFLIGTDTYQGRVAARLVQEHLNKTGIQNVQIYHPRCLSTRSTTDFTEGIRGLLKFLDEQHLDAYREQGYEVVFNLVGGFKSLQGYLNTIAMFYATEIVYIFEGQGSELLRIPRLPISIERKEISDHAVALALMDTDLAALPQEDVQGIPDLLLGDLGDGTYTLSEWGTLIWKKAKPEILGGDLLNFPRLQYTNNFLQSVRELPDHERVRLQETLAKVSALLQRNEGLAPLRAHGGLQYESYANRNDDVGHFRVSQGIRISCEPTETDNGFGLALRRYGQEPHVNATP